VSTAPTPGASRSASSSPTIWGPAVLVTGRETCLGGPGTILFDPDGITSHERGGSISCTDDANDPRVSGRLTGTWDADGWDPEPAPAPAAPGSFVEWGTMHLENEGGAWEGSFSGVYTSETGDMLTVWFTGTGGYGGLSYFQHRGGARQSHDGRRLLRLHLPGLTAAEAHTLRDSFPRVAHSRRARQDKRRHGSRRNSSEPPFPISATSAPSPYWTLTPIWHLVGDPTWRR
jgi:hypothetical protein